VRADSIVFRLNAKGSLQIDLLTRLAILEPVIELISQLPRYSIIAGSWIQSRGIDLGPAGHAGVDVGSGSRGGST
jgi:hypothetical protein